MGGQGNPPSSRNGPVRRGSAPPGRDLRAPARGGRHTGRTGEPLQTEAKAADGVPFDGERWSAPASGEERSDGGADRRSRHHGEPVVAMIADVEGATALIVPLPAHETKRRSVLRILAL
ncbi:hypothetical protein GCM10027294_31030 [Marinactinospora endophytica]